MAKYAQFITYKGKRILFVNAAGLPEAECLVAFEEMKQAIPATAADGAELRKYADIGNRLSPDFKAKDRPLYPGRRRPSRVRSVYGVIVAEVEASPGITGSEIVELLLRQDFSGISSAYTQTGQVSRPWLARYIDGAFYKKNQYLSWDPVGPEAGTDV